MPRLSVPDATLHVQVHGADGPPVVLVHGSWMDAGNWAPLVPRLTPGHRVVRYDRRGHSRSTAAAAGRRLRRDVDDLRAVVETFDAGPAHLVGNSLGGTISLRLALTRPDLVRSVVAHEPPLYGLLPHDAEVAAAVATVRHVVADVEADRVEEAAQRFVDEVALQPGAWQALPELVRATFRRNARAFAEEASDPAAWTLDLHALALLDRPVLVTRGGAGRPELGRIADALGTGLVRGHSAVVAGAGHIPHLTHPDAYARIIEDFIRRADTEPM